MMVSKPAVLCNVREKWCGGRERERTSKDQSKGANDIYRERANDIHRERANDIQWFF
jgi:hypothetical protein